MKKLIILLATLFCVNINAQIVKEDKVPKVVLNTYAKDFPSIKVIRWEKKAWSPKAHFEAVLDYNGMRTRSRYIEDGTPIFVSHFYTSAKIPTIVSAPTLASFIGFKVDWAIQTKNFLTKNDRFWLHLSKPGHILKVLVNTSDGKPVDDQNAMLEAPGDKAE